MWQRVCRIVLLGVLAAAATSAVAPTAGASVVPTLALDQSAGTAAGSFANLGVDLKFSSTAGDSPKQLTLNLPQGLLANASINGGACLTSADLNDSACQVGNGVVTAKLLGMIPVPAQVTFDLVPPPAPGDLAGLAVNNNGTQIGTTGDIRVRPRRLKRGSCSGRGQLRRRERGRGHRARNRSRTAGSAPATSTIFRRLAAPATSVTA